MIMFLPSLATLSLLVTVFIAVPAPRLVNNVYKVSLNVYKVSLKSPLLLTLGNIMTRHMACKT